MYDSKDISIVIKQLGNAVLNKLDEFTMPSYSELRKTNKTSMEYDFIKFISRNNNSNIPINCISKDYIKWIDNLKEGSIVYYHKEDNKCIQYIESKIEKVQYEIFNRTNGIWFKKFCTEHGDSFDFRGISQIEDGYIILQSKPV